VSLGHVYHDDERAPGRCLHCEQPELFECHGEVWRAVVGYEGIYSVSNRGEVRRDVPGRGTACPGKALAGRKKKYHSVILFRDGAKRPEQVHRLVLLAFVGSPTAGQQCLHADDDGLNNSLSNLSWGTPAQNGADRMRNGRMPRGAAHYSRTAPALVLRGERCGNSKLTEEWVRGIRALATEGLSTKALSLRFGITPEAVRDVLRRRTWRHVS
jgi:hypothetical protein